MGCDIHLFTERKRNINDQERWVNIDHLKLNPYYGNNEYEDVFVVLNLFEKRDYRLFSILGNVRNYSNNYFISEPRGLPHDCSELTKKESIKWGCDGHSHSYLTLEELKKFREQHRTIKFSGFMSLTDANLVDNGKMPTSWCQGTNASDYVYREWEYKNEPVGELVELLEERTREDFCLNKDADTSDYDDKIRIVFWFDN